MNRHLAALVGLGCAWGLSAPLMRVAVSTGFRPLGILFWNQVATLVACLGLLTALRLPLGLTRRSLGIVAVVAVFGAPLPGWVGFRTAAELPAGVRAIVIAIVPMFTLPIALALGAERPDARRALGVAAGAMVLLALVGPLACAIEANWIAARGAAGLHPFQLLAGAALLGAAVAGPLALASGQAIGLAPPWDAPRRAILASGLLTAFAYAGYVWLIAAAGAVFASQVSYLATPTGVGWLMLLLGERYGPGVWAAAAPMLAGVALARPRPAAENARPGKNFLPERSSRGEET